jgi:hypothetical protein
MLLGAPIVGAIGADKRMFAQMTKTTNKTNTAAKRFNPFIRISKKIQPRDVKRALSNTGTITPIKHDRYSK